MSGRSSFGTELDALGRPAMRGRSGNRSGSLDDSSTEGERDGRTLVELPD